MRFEKILVVDDERIVQRGLQSHLSRRRYQVATCGDLASARTLLGEDNFELVLLDLRLPDGEGSTLLEEIQQQPGRPLVVMMTGHGSVNSAVTCMRLGAYDYLMKPFDLEEIEVILKKAEEHSHLARVAQFFTNPQSDTTTLLLGHSPAMRQVKEMIQRVGPTQATVLIHGESGTGKELVATEIHRASPRADKPFIRVNCAAIQESLMESEFFGHEKGAFTGADKRKEGRFELAHGGTILLDEISEISPALQAKLLRVLQEREFERVGGTKTVTCDVRVIATTNRDLAACVHQGSFREDLFYRLNVFPIANPPLRQRIEDIPILARHFLEVARRQHGVPVRGFSREAMEAVRGHSWPGNVRELRNTVERAVILSNTNEMIALEALGLVQSPKPTRAPFASASAQDFAWLQEVDDIQSLAQIEKAYILAALRVAGGNRTHAARHLGIGLRTLRNKLQLYRDQEASVAEGV